MKRKTISGARAKRGQRSDGCNPEHNNRDYLPSNADPNRQHLNQFWIETTRAVTIEQVYDKLFQPAYTEWLTKEHQKGRQKDAPKSYYEKIKAQSGKKNSKRIQYEIIWQIGDMKNTGWESSPEDFEKARELLADFSAYLRELPEVTFVDKARLEDPNWRPPFDHGLIVTNLALHGDESTPQIHMDFIPYAAGCRRGQKVQNAYAAAFEGMGYAVRQEQARDEAGELLWKVDKAGELVLDKQGQKVPVMRKTAYGSIDWIEEQKGWIQQQMMERYSWDREYKGKNKFGDVSISEFVAEDNARIIRAQEQEKQAVQARLEALRRQAAATAEELGHLQEQAGHLEGELREGIQALQAQEREFDRNERLIEEQEDVLGLIRSYEDYREEALQIDQTLDLVEATSQELPMAPKLFRANDAKTWLDRMNQFLLDLFRLVDAGIQRLQIFERQYDVKELLSEPAQKRADALTEQIARASAKSGSRMTMDWKIQELYDRGAGTNFAAQDKARYFAKKNAKKNDTVGDDR